MIKPLIDKKSKIEKPGKIVERIITAARALFSERGYSATHVDEIARRAGVNKATLYYQIGDKDTLYANVIHQVIGDIAQKIAHAVTQEDNPEKKLTAYITNIVEAVDKNPEIPPIMMREIASGGRHLPEVVTEDIASILAILIGILEEGKKKGIFTETVPFLIHMMIMGTILFYKGAIQIKDRQVLISVDIQIHDDRLKNRLGEEVSKLVLKAIKVAEA